MQGFEIKQKIDENEAKLAEFFSSDTFILDGTVTELMEENDALRAICVHEFDNNGVCLYCKTPRGETIDE